MNPDNWERVKNLFDSALQRDPSERAAYIAEACQGDEFLRTEVERLLAGHDRAGSFLRGGQSETSGQDAPDIGLTLSHYQILEQLGQGGMGTVYRAIDTQLGRPVAIKVLRRPSSSDPDRDKRFLREARAASALSHPNIAHIYEVGEAGGIRFIAMEYIQGRTLAALIEGGSLDVAAIAGYGVQGASALAEAHAHGIIHRDIKPSNIMIGPRGELKVLDFGIAKVMPEVGSGGTPLTGPGMLMGTVQYMSPEQLLGRDVDHRSDIFSLGLVLYEMVAGHSPFRGAPVEMIDRILHADPQPLSRGPELARIVGKCIEKERERRYQTADELATDLRRLANGKRLAGISWPRSRSKRLVLAARRFACPCRGNVDLPANRATA